MSLSMVPLLMFDEDVPATARRALRAAEAAPAGERGRYLEAAVRALHRDAHVDCADALELVGWTPTNR